LESDIERIKRRICKLSGNPHRIATAKRFFCVEDIPYHFEREAQDPEATYEKITLYENAEKIECVRVYEGPSLDWIAREIHIRLRIAKNEIFKIGELLVNAKTLCQQQSIAFKDWISDNFDFSYETAHNFMLVYKNCFAVRNLALKIPVSSNRKSSASGGEYSHESSCKAFA